MSRSYLWTVYDRGCVGPHTRCLLFGIGIKVDMFPGSSASAWMELMELRMGPLIDSLVPAQVTLSAASRLSVICTSPTQSEEDRGGSWQNDPFHRSDKSGRGERGNFGEMLRSGKYTSVFARVYIRKNLALLGAQKKNSRDAGSTRWILTAILDWA